MPSIIDENAKMCCCIVRVYLCIACVCVQVRQTKKASLKAKNYAQTTFMFYPFSFFTPYAVPTLGKSLDLGKEIEQ